MSALCLLLLVNALEGPWAGWILNQFPSGSVSVNLAFQLSDKTLKPSYPWFMYMMAMANFVPFFGKKTEA